jgi:hypothetical protein
MNKAAIKAHLKEASGQLAATLQELDQKDYSREALRVQISHIYHHVNSAWNGRDCTSQQYRECSDEDFSRWRQFPKPSELYLEALTGGKKKKSSQQSRPKPPKWSG